MEGKTVGDRTQPTIIEQARELWNDTSKASARVTALRGKARDIHLSIDLDPEARRLAGDLVRLIDGRLRTLGEEEDRAYKQYKAIRGKVSADGREMTGD